MLNMSTILRCIRPRDVVIEGSLEKTRRATKRLKKSNTFAVTSKINCGNRDWQSIQARASFQAKVVRKRIIRKPRAAKIHQGMDINKLAKFLSQEMLMQCFELYVIPDLVESTPELGAQSC